MPAIATEQTDPHTHVYRGVNSAGEAIEVTWNVGIVVVQVVIHDTPQPAHYRFRMDEEQPCAGAN